MSRPKGSRNRQDRDEAIESTPEVQPVEENIDSEETVSIYEASQQLGVSELAIKTWVDHGHLSFINGRIPVRSIRECRFNVRRFI